MNTLKIKTKNGDNVDIIYGKNIELIYMSDYIIITTTYEYTEYIDTRQSYVCCGLLFMINGMCDVSCDISYGGDDVYKVYLTVHSELFDRYINDMVEYKNKYGLPKLCDFHTTEQRKEYDAINYKFMCVSYKRTSKNQLSYENHKKLLLNGIHVDSLYDYGIDNFNRIAHTIYNFTKRRSKRASNPLWTAWDMNKKEQIEKYYKKYSNVEVLRTLFADALALINRKNKQCE